MYEKNAYKSGYLLVRHVPPLTSPIIVQQNAFRNDGLCADDLGFYKSDSRAVSLPKPQH